AMLTWKVNSVRVPLNESCWLGIGVPAEFAGANYQQAIADYVDLLSQKGLYPILELHWSRSDDQPAGAQDPMPNRNHSVDFWKQAAGKSRGKGEIIFDLSTEPFPDNNDDTDEAWRCWRDGGTCAGMDFQAAGMQELVTAVREQGAQNVVALGGVEYSNALSQW